MESFALHTQRIPSEFSSVLDATNSEAVCEHRALLCCAEKAKLSHAYKTLRNKMEKQIQTLGNIITTLEKLERNLGDRLTIIEAESLEIILQRLYRLYKGLDDI